MENPYWSCCCSSSPRSRRQTVGLLALRPEIEGALPGQPGGGSAAGESWLEAPVAEDINAVKLASDGDIKRRDKPQV